MLNVFIYFWLASAIRYGVEEFLSSSLFTEEQFVLVSFFARAAGSNYFE